MAKQLNVNMSIQADTTQAKKALSDLNKTLDNILSHHTITVEDQSIQQAKQAALDLKHHLDAAVNVNTGKLDLSKFSASLNKSGQSLQGLYTNLSKIGPEGQSAFLSLSQSIAKADASAITLGSKLGSLMATLKNTIKWQISSSILHGFMGSIQGAYRYAQDLNESLNNIRIVTGQNEEQMARFAKEANSAAKALSTTTTEYTNASLIYYQQGLSDKEVKARTDATIKLANVSRQSAEEVSDQMTAVWNNFAEGSDNLEYYIDVMAKLGATTASSTKEISTGLEKFAAVAKTVGLSYEYATAALATVTAKTRQSADVVGTAFKTLFARLQDLELGDTLEDGTTLGKYSAALNAVGVNIKNINGEVKDMDVILDELGSKWNTIAKDQQIALAQTVAGTRQYTQLIALMDNWDFMQENLETAAGASGELDRQAEIYAESWEAARDRVRAAAEEIYSQLVNDDAFIDILNGFEKFLNLISNVIDGLGGLKGILLLIGSIFMQQYAKEMPVFMSKMISNIQILTGAAEKQRQSMLSNLTNIVSGMDGGDSKGLSAQITGMQKVSEMYQELALKRKTLSSAEIEAYEQKIKDVEMYSQMAEAIGIEVDKLNEEANALKRDASKDLQNAGNLNGINSNLSNENLSLINPEFEKINVEIEKAKKGIEETKDEANSPIGQAWRDYLKELQNDAEQLKQKLSGKDLLQGFEEASRRVGKIQSVLDTISGKTSQWSKEIKNIGTNSKAIENLQKEIIAYRNKLEEAGVETKELDEAIKTFKNDGTGLQEAVNIISTIGDNDPALKIAKAEAAVEQYKSILVELGVNSTVLDDLAEKWKTGAISTEQYKAALKELEAQQKGTLTHGVKMSEVFTQLGSTMMQASMAINAIKNIGNIWSDKDMSTGEKILQTMTAMGTLFPTLVGLYETFTKIKAKHATTTGADAAASIANAGAKTAEAVATTDATVAQKAFNTTMESNPIGGVIIAIIALTAALGILITVLMAVVNAETEEEKAVRLTNERFEESKKAAEEARAAYEELKNAISNYDNILEALDKCVKGTQEWRDAFQEVLDKTYELIEKYPQLLRYEDLFNNDGTLNREVLQRALDAAEQTKILTQNSLLRASAQKTTAEFNLNRTETEKEASEKIDQQQVDNWTGLKKTSEIVNDIAVKLQTNGQIINEENIKKEVLAYLKENEVSADKINTIANTITAAMTPLADDFKNLGNEAQASANALNNAQKLIAQNLFGEQLEKTPDKEFAYIQAYNEQIEKELNDINNTIGDQFSDHRGGSSDNVENGKIGDSKELYDFFEDWKKATGHEEYSLVSDDAIEYYEGSRAYQYHTGNGDDTAHAKFINMREDVAAYRAAQNLEAVMARADEIFNGMSSRLNNMTGAGSAAMTAFLNNGDIGASSVRSAEILAEKAQQYQGTNEEFIQEMLTGQTEEKGKEALIQYLAKKYDISEELVKSGGYYDNFIRESTEALSFSFDDAIKGATQRVKNSISQLKDGLDVSSIDKVTNMYTKALAESGEAGIKVLDDIAAAAGEEAGNVMNVLADLDLSTTDVDQINTLLESLGINFKITEDQLTNFKNVLVETGKITAEEAQKTYKEISSILSNLKKEGDTIEQEAYDKLLKLNPALSSYFTMMADGTYMLTGAAEDFRRAVQSSQIEQIRQAQRNQAETAMAYTSLQGENFNQITEAKDEINQIVNQTVAEAAKNAGMNLGFRTREEMTKFATNQGAINEEDLWNTYGSTINAQLRILKDNGVDTKDWQAQIEAGENLVNVIFDVNDAYNELGLSEEDYSKKASEAAEEVIKLNEAMKEASYQAEIANANLDYETTEQYADVLMELYEAEGMTKDQARELAIANQRLDRGLNSLNDNFEEWTKSLKNTGKNTAEYAQTISGVREAFSDLLNIADADELSLGWIEQWINDGEKMKKIMDGDQEAIQELRESAFTEMTTNVFTDMKNSIQEMIDSLNEAGEEVPERLQAINNALASGKFEAENLRAAIQDLSENEIGSGAVLSQEYVDSLNQMLAAGVLTEQQLNDIFSQIGYKPKVTTATVDQETYIPEYTTEEVLQPGQTLTFNDGTGDKTYTGIKKISRTYQSGGKTMMQKIPVAQIESANKAGGNIDIVNAGAQRIAPSHGATSSGGGGGKSGGGGGKAKEPTKKETKNPTDEKDRYHVIKEQLDDLSQAYDRVNKAKDRAFGANKLAGIKAEQKILKEQIDAQDEYLRQIKEMGKYDINNLQHGKEKGFAMDGEWYATGGLSCYGLEAQFDENGVLTNYDQIVKAAVAKYNEAVAYYNSLTGEQQENDKSLEFAEKQYSSFMDLLKQYEETNNLFQDETDKRQELINQWQDNNYEALSYEIELKLKINEDELKWLEYQLKKIGDDVYKTSEAIANLFSLEGSSQAGVAVQTMDDLLTHMNKLDEAYAKGEISEADYFAALEETKDGMYEQLEAMMAIDEQMEEYYANTLSKITEELDKFTDSMRHNIDVVNHMKDILELSGRGQDYEAMGSLLNANMSQTGDIYQASKERYDMLVRQEEEAQARLEEALRTGGKEEQEIAQKNLDAIIAARQEAENIMYEDWKAHLEACNAVLENELNRTKKVWDDIYTDGQGWEYLEQVMDLAQRIGDKYLTKTNQLYETNKMLRTIQQDMDKTTNKAAQQRLNNFAKEIQNLQQIGELSKDNLEIAKAQYEVLKAEIALEEAQNAKSTVRLQRDNEGNYGYVYTADQDKVEDARQQLEDRRNDLYNLALEQENKNAQDILQINKEKNEALDALNRQYYIDKTITEEEYNQRSQEIQQKYNDLLLAATKDHLIARTILNQESITGENDSWTAEYADLVNKGYAYIDDQNEFWNLGFGAITNNRQQWFSTEGPEWDAFYNNIMNGANQTQIAWNNELATMQNNTKPAIEAFNAAVGVDEQSGVRGTLLNLQTKLKDVTTATSDYKEQLVGDDGLIKNLGEEASKVQESTTQWGKYYDKLKGQGGVISAVEEAITKIKELIKVASTNASATYTTTYVRVGSPEPNMKDQSATYTTNYVSNGSPSGGGGSGGGSISSGNGQKTWQKNVYKQKNSSYHDVYNHYTDGSETFAYTEPHSFNGKECTKCKYKKSGGSGCFEGDTKIILEDYSEKMIKDIKIGDKVLAYNEEKHYFEVQPVLDIFIKRNNNHTVNVNLSNGITLKMTAGHPILTTSGWKSRDLEESLLEHGMNVNYLNIGDIVLGFGISGKVESITDNYYEKNNNIVYTLKIDVCHTFIANNIIVHNSKVATPFASGGYTGEWIGGSQLDNGKLAILHQKELVLNEDDTKNMLQTVSLVRELSNTIGLRAAASSVATGLSSAFTFDNAQTLEQSVTIHAEFPNAVNHNEIEEAFNTLINRASQFAGRSTF